MLYLIFLFLSVFGAVEGAFAQDFRPQPEISTTVNLEKKAPSPAMGAYGAQAMAVTAHPLATKAAQDVLDNGGNAIDALVVAQLVLGLVEPQSSGLGGGAFLLYHDVETGETVSFDARETAPIRAYPDMFLTKEGVALGFYEAALSGLSIGVPGVPKLLDHIHSRYGSLKWGALFDAPIFLAQDGFKVLPRFVEMVENQKEKLSAFPKTASYFEQAHVMGAKLKNPKYAETLLRFKEERSSYFYEGDFAQQIADASISNGGYMERGDLEVYEVKERKTLCDVYRGYKICSMNEPSSGGLTILHMLKMLEHFDLSEGATAENLHRIIETSRLAFADRNQYMADSDFVKTPNTMLLEQPYIDQRSALIGTTAMDQVVYGLPDGWNEARASDASKEEPGTSHISIIDRDGNIASMTTTIESAFGSHVMVGGFLLNNELTDFSFVSERDGKLVANRVQGGKRPRSSMSPTIVFDPDGAPFLVIGSAGGSRIIGYVLQRIIALIDWNMSLEEAMNAPHILSRGGGVDVELGHDYPIEALKALGHEVTERDLNSGLTGIHIKKGHMVGVADPRRDGVALLSR